MTDLVTTEHVGNTQQDAMLLPRSCLVHPVNRFDSEGWFSSDQVIFLTVFCVFFGEKACNIKVKRRNFGVSCFQGSAEALVRCCGKIKHIWIAYFLSNIYAKKLS